MALRVWRGGGCSWPTVAKCGRRVVLAEADRTKAQLVDAPRKEIIGHDARALGVGSRDEPVVGILRRRRRVGLEASWVGVAGAAGSVGALDRWGSGSQQAVHVELCGCAGRGHGDMVPFVQGHIRTTEKEGGYCRGGVLKFTLYAHDEVGLACGHVSKDREAEVSVMRPGQIFANDGGASDE